jgi:hypothetical protein
MPNPTASWTSPPKIKTPAARVVSYADRSYRRVRLDGGPDAVIEQGKAEFEAMND